MDFFGEKLNWESPNFRRDMFQKLVRPPSFVFKMMAELAAQEVGIPIIVISNA